MHALANCSTSHAVNICIQLHGPAASLYVCFAKYKSSFVSTLPCNVFDLFHLHMHVFYSINPNSPLIWWKKENNREANKERECNRECSCSEEI